MLILECLRLLTCLLFLLSVHSYTTSHERDFKGTLHSIVARPACPIKISLFHSSGMLFLRVSLCSQLLLIYNNDQPPGTSGCTTVHGPYMECIQGNTVMSRV